VNAWLTVTYWPANAAMVTSQPSQQNSDDDEEEDGEGEGDVKPESDGRIASAAAAGAINTLKQHSSSTHATHLRITFTDGHDYCAM